MRAPSPAVRKIIADLSVYRNGLPRDELLRRARSLFPGQNDGRLRALIDSATADGHLILTEGTYRAAPTVPSTADGPSTTALTTTTGEPTQRGLLRAVIVDLESVVRTTTVAPYTDKRIYQLGAARTGTDTAWIAQQPTFSAWVRLPDGDWPIVSDAVRALHAASALAPVDALADLSAFCDTAELVIAYNGYEADFPLLATAYDHHGLANLPGEYVDGYYLTLAVWPGAETHRLGALAGELAIDTSDLRWHDAGQDAILLDRVLRRAAQKFTNLGGDVTSLVAAICPDSGAWRLLRALAGDLDFRGHGTPHTQPQIAAITTAALASVAPLRGAGGAQGRRTLVLADELLGEDGRCDPVALAAAARGGNASRRQAQQDMTATLHRWADRGTSGLIEAPTGTGKSYAILAAALDWLAGAPDRTAIIATYTKQLQQQLSHDVTSLDATIGGLVEASVVVKGSANRLSLRSLLATMADATELDQQRRGPARSGSTDRFLRSVLFRELLTYLYLRLLAVTDSPASWQAHSVDPVDVPAFFDAYANKRLAVWLDSLSQARSGEYPRSSQPVADYTDIVTDALAGHRLILANHALLLAHTDDLATLGGDTLLVVDEAHALEDAATAALSAVMDYRLVEDLHAELAAWAIEQRMSAERAAVSDRVSDLGDLLDVEQIPKAASLAFDARSGGTIAVVGSRAVTLASAYTGTPGITQVQTLTGLLRRLVGHFTALTGALGGYHKAHGQAMDFFASERLQALICKVAAAKSSCEQIVGDIDAVFGAPAPTPPPAPPASVTANIDDDDDDQVGDTDVDDSNAAGPAVSAAPMPARPNRVVFAEETEQLRTGLRRYRFTITSSPIDLGEDLGWRSYLATFPRSYYVSATLRVAGGWTYITGRLALPPDLPAVALETPFDLAEQAELVCFSDFPSWTEQAEGAMRTVAHQLTGYSRELIHAVPSAAEEDGAATVQARGGFDGGALVLTTSRATAAGITEHLEADLAKAGSATPVKSALVLGNRRAVDDFTAVENGGGIVVGTRGLWQGVDVADEQRLRMVWINKIPFAPFAAPIIESRRAAVAARAEYRYAEDPDQEAAETYYLPLAALALRQAAGRLIRSEKHRGVIVISDRKLGGMTALRRAYRHTFLGSLDEGLLRTDEMTGELAGGNVTTMADGWARIWQFYARAGLVTQERADELCDPDALEEHTLLPQTRRIRQLALTNDEAAAHRAAGTLEAEVVARAAQIGGLLRLSDAPTDLKDGQKRIIAAVAAGRNVLGLLPTGFGKSFCFQLPALVLPGTTLVISPLVALMTDQALELNRSIGGAVRALVAPLRESSSRAGKTEVADELLGRASHGIKLIYLSPERLAQTRMRQIIRDAVAAGRVTRIAIDEAHTAAQWGDDFRPSFRRAEQFLAELRTEFGLPVTALTATANHTVRASLRSNMFGLPAHEPADGDGDTLVTVTENPIRPELAIFRRTLRQAGPIAVAGLAEEIVDTVTDHTIIYCLTVKEVVALHSHLRDYVGDGGAQVLRFHGRLTEAEKVAVMTAFREAPVRGEDEFRPLIIVATSAFGLGVNRPDVRGVFCASAPTDLAALYQQLGRAGRDAAGRGDAIITLEDPDGYVVDDAPTSDATAADIPAEAAPVANVGMALLTNRGLRTAAFMSSSDVPMSLLIRAGELVLAAGGVLDTVEAADLLVSQDLASGALTADEVVRATTDYRGAMMRSFTALAGLGAVIDGGDFPPWLTIKKGELLSSRDDEPGAGDDPDVRLEAAVCAAILRLPTRSDGLHHMRARTAELDALLAAVIDNYRDAMPDVAATWQLLSDLHDRGQLDVSAAPTRYLVTSLTPTTGVLPPGYAAALSGKAARARTEIRLLQEFFTEGSVCANVKFAEYFGVDVPIGCCTGPENYCSACWASTKPSPGDTEPASGNALMTPNPRAAGWRDDTATKAAKLDENLRLLIHHVYRGVHPADLRRVLRGEDSYYSPKHRRRFRLPSGLTQTRLFGSNFAITTAQVTASLTRLQATGTITAAGPLWRMTDYVVRDQQKAAATALAATGSAVAAP